MTAAVAPVQRSSPVEALGPEQPGDGRSPLLDAITDAPANRNSVPDIGPSAPRPTSGRIRRTPAAVGAPGSFRERQRRVVRPLYEISDPSALGLPDDLADTNQRVRYHGAHDRSSPRLGRVGEDAGCRAPGAGRLAEPPSARPASASGWRLGRRLGSRAGASRVGGASVRRSAALALAHSLAMGPPTEGEVEGAGLGGRRCGAGARARRQVRGPRRPRARPSARWSGRNGPGAWAAGYR